MFIKNSWYAAAWDSEVGEKPLGRIVLNEPVVLFRTSSGIAALEDRCPHRRVPLHLGRVSGETIACGYHGFVFSSTGQCVKVPGQKAVPKAVCVRAYPAVIKYSIVWIWMGDPALADENRIPDYSHLVHPQWRGKGSHIHVAANYRLIVENLLDLTHLAFVHSTTIGNSAVAEGADVTFKADGDRVEIVRWIIDAEPPPTYVKAGGFTGRVDRWQIITFEPPAFIRLYTGATDTGTGAPQGNRQGGIGLRNLNLITPETERTSHYFWAQCHDFRLDEPDLTQTIFEQVQTAFLEDKVIFEAQQKSIDMCPQAPEYSVKGDTGGIYARRILDRWLATEADQDNSGPRTT